LPFVPRTIVKFSLVEPIDDKQMLKKKVRSAFLFPVTYVDADVGKSEYHVRCSDEEQAKKLAGVTCLGNASILTGDEEASYWERIQKQRREKRNKSTAAVDVEETKKKKVRGRERHRARAEEMKNSHTYFGGDDDDT